MTARRKPPTVTHKTKNELNKNAIIIISSIIVLIVVLITIALAFSQ